ncbi:hypothetical protein HaLaN_15592 [Haematococcus lacustris]|uniref:Uncharacterized protein n=1 Tax=Haematococcus lacustris TaxID=44745 RepID=A0A699ZBF6_HAELA|nr:hypothetical protein HaLaN_15592 [Haematococcus lacustris]
MIPFLSPSPCMSHLDAVTCWAAGPDLGNWVPHRGGQRHQPFGDRPFSGRGRGEGGRGFGGEGGRGEGPVDGGRPEGRGDRPFSGRGRGEGRWAETQAVSWSAKAGRCSSCWQACQGCSRRLTGASAVRLRFSWCWSDPVSANVSGVCGAPWLSPCSTNVRDACPDMGASNHISMSWAQGASP